MGLTFDREEDSVRYSSGLLLNAFATTPAPPSGNRMCGLQEIETILCKWKSHINGHYPVGNDVREIRHALVAWEMRSKTAARLLAVAPTEFGMLGL
jgi:hypothetical protein